jgi:hypothetical protein
LPEIKKHLDSERGNIAAAGIVDGRGDICVSLNYVVSAFAFLRERGKSLVSERQVGKKEIFSCQ